MKYELKIQKINEELGLRKDKSDKLLARLTKKEKTQMKSKVRKDTVQLIPQKYKVPLGTIKNNYIQTNWKT